VLFSRGLVHLGAASWSSRPGFQVWILFSAPLRARLRLTAETLRRRVKVGHAVHCAPGLVMLTRPLGLESCPPRSSERGYGPHRSRSKKAPGHTRPTLRALRPGWPRAKSAQRRAGVHARRNNTVLNIATSPFPLLCHFHTPKRPQNQS